MVTVSPSCRLPSKLRQPCVCKHQTWSAVQHHCGTWLLSATYQCTDNQSSRAPIATRLIVFALGDDIPLLIGSARAVHQRDRDQILTEVARRRVDEETLSIGSAYGDTAECPCSRLITLVRLGGSRRLQSTASSRHRHGFGGIHSQNVSGTSLRYGRGRLGFRSSG